MKRVYLVFLAWFMVYMTGTAIAGDREELVKLYQYPGCVRKIDTVKITGTWAMVSWSFTEGGGMDLYHRIDDRWRCVTGGGGAMGPVDLNREGVPESLWTKLLHYSPSAEDIHRGRSEDGPYWKWLCSDKKATNEDLRMYSGWELTLMRNEIFARHGMRFKDPELKEYFESRSWYRADPAFTNDMLTATEKYNVKLILQYQKDHDILY